MRRKFKLKVCYTFHGYFTLRAASGKEAARLVSEQCGTVLNTIRTTLGEESEVDWQFDKHPRFTVREVIALPETLDGEKLPRVGISTPGNGSSGVILPMKRRDIIPYVRVMTTWKNPLRMISSGFVLRLRKPKFFRANYVPYSKNVKDTFK